MRIRQRFITFLIFMAVTLPAATYAADKKIPLKTAVFDGCPFICLDGSGVFLDNLRLSLVDTPYRLELVNVPFQRAKKWIVDGTIDLLPGILKGGIDGVYFPDSWLFFTQMCFFVNSDDDWTYDGIDSLDKRTLIVEKGIIHTPEFYAYIKNKPGVISLTGIDILSRQLEMLKIRRADTITAEQTVLKYHLKKNVRREIDVPSKAGCFAPEYEFVAVSPHRHDSRTLTDLLTRRLEAIRHQPEFQEMFQ